MPVTAFLLEFFRKKKSSSQRTIESENEILEGTIAVLMVKQVF